MVEGSCLPGGEVYDDVVVEGGTAGGGAVCGMEWLTIQWSPLFVYGHQLVALCQMMFWSAVPGCEALEVCYDTSMAGQCVCDGPWEVECTLCGPVHTCQAIHIPL